MTLGFDLCSISFVFCVSPDSYFNHISLCRVSPPSSGVNSKFALSNNCGRVANFLKAQESVKMPAEGQADKGNTKSANEQRDEPPPTDLIYVATHV